jgi:hypothetical protein
MAHSGSRHGIVDVLCAMPPLRACLAPDSSPLIAMQIYPKLSVPVVLALGQEWKQPSFMPEDLEIRVCIACGCGRADAGCMRISGEYEIRGSYMLVMPLLSLSRGSFRWRQPRST